MKLVHEPSFYVQKPKPVYDVDLRGNGFLIGLSTKLTGTLREREPDPHARVLPPNFIGIDFETEDVQAWIERAQNATYDFSSMPRYTRDLILKSRIFFGVFPVEYEERNVWKCSFDRYLEIMSHRQHYRAKDIPMFFRRCEFSTVADFSLIISAPHIKHVIVDSLTHQLLAENFEEIQDHAQIAGPAANELGLILTIGDRLIFADTYLPPERQWVNNNPGVSNRPQFIIVDPSLVKPYGV